MKEFKSREDLYEKVVGAFSKQPEVREISIFGRNAEGTADQYSDIDIRIISSDLHRTQQNYIEIFNTISPILEKFSLVSETDNFAQMIMLKDYAPYQKIDFGICTRESPFTPSTCVYKNEHADYKDSRMDITAIKFDTNYNLTNFLFGVPKITKCFFRKDFDMYRRWQDMTNAVLVLLFEKYNGFEKETQKRTLDAGEAKKLFAQLSTEDKECLNRILPVSGNLFIPASFLSCLELYIALSKEKAKHFRASLNTSFIDYIYNFAKMIK